MNKDELKEIIGEIEDINPVININEFSDNYKEISAYVVPNDEETKNNIRKIINEYYKTLYLGEKGWPVRILGQYGMGKSHLLALFYLIIGEIDLGAEFSKLQQKSRNQFQKTIKIEDEVINKINSSRILVLPVNLLDYSRKSIIDVLELVIEEHSEANNLTTPKFLYVNSVIDWYDNQFDEIELKPIIQKKMEKEYSDLEEIRKYDRSKFANIISETIIKTKMKVDIEKPDNKELLSLFSGYAKDNNYDGIFFLFDEFSEYYQGLDDRTKHSVNHTLQVFAENGYNYNLTYALTMQEKLVNEIINVEKILARLEDIQLKSISVSELIINKILPNRSINNIKKLYKKSEGIKYNFELAEIEKTYPFNPVTIALLKNTTTELSTQNRNMLGFSKDCINHWIELEPDIDQSTLINPNILFRIFYNDSKIPFRSIFKIGIDYLEEVRLRITNDYNYDIITFVKILILYNKKSVNLKLIKQGLMYIHSTQELKVQIDIWLKDILNKIPLGKIKKEEDYDINRITYSFLPFSEATGQMDSILKLINDELTLDIVKKAIWEIRLLKECNMIKMSWYTQEPIVRILSEYEEINQLQKRNVSEFNLLVCENKDSLNRELLQLTQKSKYTFYLETHDLEKIQLLKEYLSYKILEYFLKGQEQNNLLKLINKIIPDLAPKIKNNITKIEEPTIKKILIDFEEHLKTLYVEVKSNLNGYLLRGKIKFEDNSRIISRKKNVKGDFPDNIDNIISKIFDTIFDKNPKVAKRLTSNSRELFEDLIIQKELASTFTKSQIDGITLTGIPLGLIPESFIPKTKTKLILAPQGVSPISAKILELIEAGTNDTLELTEIFSMRPYFVKVEYIYFIICAMVSQNLITMKDESDIYYNTQSILDLDLNEFQNSRFFLNMQETVNRKVWEFFIDNGHLFDYDTDKMAKVPTKDYESELLNQITANIIYKSELVEIFFEKFSNILCKLIRKEDYCISQTDFIFPKLVALIEEHDYNTLVEIFEFLERDDKIRLLDYENRLINLVNSEIYSEWINILEELRHAQRNKIIDKINIDFYDTESSSIEIKMKEIYGSINSLDKKEKFETYLLQSRKRYEIDHDKYNEPIEIPKFINEKWIKKLVILFQTDLIDYNFDSFDDIIQQARDFNIKICGKIIFPRKGVFNYHCDKCHFSPNQRNETSNNLNKKIKKILAIYTVFAEEIFANANVQIKSKSMDLMDIDKVSKLMNLNSKSMTIRVENIFNLLGINMYDYLTLKEIEEKISNYKLENSIDQMFSHIIINFEEE
jgi:hypothetical protein